MLLDHTRMTGFKPSNIVHLIMNSATTLMTSRMTGFKPVAAVGSNIALEQLYLLPEVDLISSN
jgi:hypothetical protein